MFTKSKYVKDVWQGALTEIERLTSTVASSLLQEFACVIYFKMSWEVITQGPQSNFEIGGHH